MEEEGYVSPARKESRFGHGTAGAKNYNVKRKNINWAKQGGKRNPKS